MLILYYVNIIKDDLYGLSSIGYVLLYFIPYVIFLMIVTLPALLIAYSLTILLFRLPATRTERYVLMHFFMQAAVVSNIIICVTVVCWMLDEKNWAWQLFALKYFWPAYAAAALSALLRFKAFIQLTEDLKPVQHETDLV